MGWKRENTAVNIQSTVETCSILIRILNRDLFYYILLELGFNRHYFQYNFIFVGGLKIRLQGLVGLGLSTVCLLKMFIVITNCIVGSRIALFIAKDMKEANKSFMDKSQTWIGY